MKIPPRLTDAVPSRSDQAQQLARSGLHVHPLAPRGKRPSTAEGYKDATNDPAQIALWWEQRPDANIGVACGASNLVVLDEDKPGEVGRLCAQYKQPVPETMRVATGKGWHWYFGQPSDGPRIRNSGIPKKLGYEIDVRGDGGYVVGPGSIHPEGAVYKVDGGRHGITAIPGWLADLLRDRGTPSAARTRPADAKSTEAKRSTTTSPAATRLGLAALERELAEFKATRNGGRNNQLNRSTFNLSQLARDGQLGREQVRQELTKAALTAGLDEREIAATISSAMAAGEANPRSARPTAESMAGELDLGDSPLADWVAEQTQGEICWYSGLNWLMYDGRVWQTVSEPDITERVRQLFVRLHQDEIARPGVSADRRRLLNTLHSAAKVGAVVRLLKGSVSVQAGGTSPFDAHPDLLCVGNGVVDLRTGELLSHDPALLLTKTTPVEYVPNARHPDWEMAVGALPGEVADWLQVRFGQAVTGHMTPDDVLPVLQGGGENGKSTVTAAVLRAAGDHATVVPERLLLANPSDHPTELTTLMGARLALIEETPENRPLSVGRLKNALGTPRLTARKIQRDNVTWDASHSLFLTTNYRPRISETDHGTWRRLALVVFPYTFRKTADQRTGPNERVGDPRLRERLREGREGQHQAVLAWLVAGAKRWYDADRQMPEPPEGVRRDTESWRGDSDQILRYISDRLVFDPQSVVLRSELYEDFRSWQETAGHQQWSDQRFTPDFGSHDEVVRHNVAEQRMRPRGRLSTRVPGGSREVADVRRVWVGLRFRRANEEDL
jgi:P4 family phage/plasmid primase-like protien